MLHFLETYGGFKILNTIDTEQNPIFRIQEIWCNGWRAIWWDFEW